MTGTAAGTTVRSMHAMASTVTFTVVKPAAAADAALARAMGVVRQVEQTCSRFDGASALSRANAEPDAWHDVPATLALALDEAARAHAETGGLFDPRVLDILLTWGYDSGMTFGPEEPAAAGRHLPGVIPPWQRRGPWRPRVQMDGRTGRVHLGDTAVDLGGIGKGLAVRWAAASLVDAGAGAMVAAGGDLVVRGPAPDGERWLVGVEDPSGAETPLAVLGLRDAACATSSVRRRRWRVGSDDVVHHLVDPRTGEPGGTGLLAVTVVADDPAWAEVWAKSLFLDGRSRVRAQARERGLAAIWVGSDGEVGCTPSLRDRVTWSRVSLETGPSGV